MQTKFRLPKFDPTDAMAVITGHRKQHFAAERELALIGFGAWIRFSGNPRLVCDFQVLAAANYYLHLPKASRNRWIAANPFCSQEGFAHCLLKYPVEALELSNYWSELELNEILDIREIIEFFMSCPSERRPSLLKAIYFISEGGFLFDIADRTNEKGWNRSSTTLKNAWTKMAVAAPFIWVSQSKPYDAILNLCPTAPSAIKRVRNLLANKDVLLEFFGIARFCQDHLMRQLNRQTLDRFDFVNFAPNVETIEVELHPFEPPQLELLKAYRAPKLIYDLGN